jgi:hypothetical protein
MENMLTHIFINIGMIIGKKLKMNIAKGIVIGVVYMFLNIIVN